MKTLRTLAILMALGFFAGWVFGQTTCPTCPPLVTLPPGASIVVQAPQTIATASGPVYVETSIDAGDTLTAASGTFDSVAPLAANFWTVGKTLDVWAVGTQIVGALNTTLLGLYMDTTVLLAPNGGYPNGLASATLNRFWKLHARIICTAVGTTGTLEVQGELSQYGDGTDATNTPQTVALGNIAPITVDTTAAQTLSIVLGKMQTGSGNSITMRQFIVQ